MLLFAILIKHLIIPRNLIDLWYFHDIQCLRLIHLVIKSVNHHKVENSVDIQQKEIEESLVTKLFLTLVITASRLNPKLNAFIEHSFS